MTLHGAMREKFTGLPQMMKYLLPITIGLAVKARCQQRGQGRILEDPTNVIDTTGPIHCYRNDKRKVI